MRSTRIWDCTDAFVEHGLEEGCKAVLEQRVKDFEEVLQRQSAAGQKSQSTP